MRRLVAVALLAASCTVTAPPLDSGLSATTTTVTTTTTASMRATTATTVAAPTTAVAAPPQTAAASQESQEPVVVLVVGDFGTGRAAERRVARAMHDVAVERGATVFLTTGDNLYVDDAEAAWVEPFGWVDDLGLEVVVAWGNHDVESGSRREIVATTFGLPGPWYTVDVGRATVVVLDSESPGDPEQEAFLGAVLAAPDTGPRIAVFHRPAYSCGRHGSTAWIVERWVPRLRAGGVDLVLSGHDHDYQRFEADGVIYVVSGGGGGGLYPAETCPAGTPLPLALDDENHHFLVLEVGAATVEVEAVAVDGTVLDRVTAGG